MGLEGTDPGVGIHRSLVRHTVSHPGCKGMWGEHIVAVADLLVQLGQVGRLLAKDLFVRTGDRKSVV